jgi:hypothetical protein
MPPNRIQSPTNPHLPVSDVRVLKPPDHVKGRFLKYILIQSLRILCTGAADLCYRPVQSGNIKL